MDIKKMKKEELYQTLLCKEEELRLATETNASLIEHNNRLNATIAEGKNIASQLRAKATELSKEIVSKEDMICKLKKEFLEETKKIKVLTNKSESYLTIIRELRDKIDGNNETISFLSARKAALETDCSEFEEQVANYNQKLVESNNIIAELNDKVEELTAKNSRLETVNASLDNDISNMASRIRTIDEKEETIDELTRALDDKDASIEYHRYLYNRTKKRLYINNVISIVVIIILWILILVS